MIIRPATRDDIPHIRELEQQSGTAAHWAERDYDTLFLPDAPKRLALVALEESDGNGVCGFVVARCSSEEWEIENVVVRADRRRQGVGGAIVAEVVQRAQAAGAESVILEVRESNLAARNLYKSIGFQEIGRRQGYYENPAEPAIVMKFHSC